MLGETSTVVFIFRSIIKIIHSWKYTDRNRWQTIEDNRRCRSCSIMFPEAIEIQHDNNSNHVLVGRRFDRSNESSCRSSFVSRSFVGFTLTMISLSSIVTRVSSLAERLHSHSIYHCRKKLIRHENSFCNNDTWHSFTHCFHTLSHEFSSTCLVCFLLRLRLVVVITIINKLNSHVLDENEKQFDWFLSK
jgi:hypothetical protein